MSEADMAHLRELLAWLEREARYLWWTDNRAQAGEKIAALRNAIALLSEQSEAKGEGDGDSAIAQ